MRSVKGLVGIISLILLFSSAMIAQNSAELFTVQELEMTLGTNFSVNKNNLNFNIEYLPGVENINVTENPMPQNETAMAVNPANPNNLVISMNDFRQGFSGQSIAYSMDGGETWGTHLAAAPQKNIYYIDPSVCFDNSGNVLLAYLAVNQGAQLRGTAIVVLKSQDGGKTWQEPVFVQDDLNNTSLTHSRPFLTIDQNNNDIYVAWVVTEGSNAFPVIARSQDSGASFSTWIRINESQGAVRHAIPAVDAKGQIYVTYFDLLTSTAHIAKSVDHGDSFSEVHSIQINQIGEQFGFRHILKNAVKVNSYPSIAVDNSQAPSNGNVYLCWADNRLGNPDIFMIKSTNEGRAWSEPVKINNDESGTDQFFPAATVDAITGALNVAFYDSRNDENNELVDTYIAQSVDGGETFVNTRISTASSNPKVGFEQGGEKFFGDYLAVAAHNNTIYSAFTDSREGNQEIYVAKFNKTTGQTEVVADAYSLEQNYPNPFNPTTMISFTLPEQSVVSLKIYNSLGEQVATLIDGELRNADKYQLTFDASNLTSGFYFYRLQAGDFVQTRKLMLLK